MSDYEIAVKLPLTLYQANTLLSILKKVKLEEFNSPDRASALHIAMTELSITIRTFEQKKG